ncbi:unnamed protein product [Trichobilharzia regenti]|nr:unnamed protein product [Trichobilharzia regenti]
MHSSPGRGVPHNKSMVGSQHSVDSYGNKKASSTHSNNNYKSSFERSNHSTGNQSVPPSYSDMNSMPNQQQQQPSSQYRYSDSYNNNNGNSNNNNNLHRQTNSNPNSSNANYSDYSVNSSGYTNSEYNVNSSELYTPTSQLQQQHQQQSCLHRFSCGLSQCPQCYPYHQLIAQSCYNLPNSGVVSAAAGGAAALQPPLVLSPTMLNNYSTPTAAAAAAAMCCPSTATQIPYYFWYNNDYADYHQKQYYPSQLGLSKLNIDPACLNQCMVIPSESSDLMQAGTNPVRQNEADSVYDPNSTAAAAWYPGYWNSPNLWMSSTTLPAGYLPQAAAAAVSYTRPTLPMPSFSPNSQAAAFTTPEDQHYTLMHQPYVNPLPSDFTTPINHQITTDLLANYNLSQQLQSQQMAAAMTMMMSNCASPLSSTSSVSAAAAAVVPVATGTSTTTNNTTSTTSTTTPPTVTCCVSSTITNKNSSFPLYYANMKSNDALTVLQNAQYCAYPPVYYTPNAATAMNVLTSANTNISQTPGIQHSNNSGGSNNNTNNIVNTTVNNSNTNNHMRLLLTLLAANSQANNASSIATPNIVHTPYRYSPDNRNSLLYNRQKISVNSSHSSSGTSLNRSVGKILFPESELARLNLK